MKGGGPIRSLMERLGLVRNAEDTAARYADPDAAIAEAHAAADDARERRRIVATEVGTIRKAPR